MKNRIDIIGQNGNDGTHYQDENPDGVSYTPPKDNMFVDDYIPQNVTPEDTNEKEKEEDDTSN